jgi:predicted RNA-binding protein with PIN domain
VQVARAGEAASPPVPAPQVLRRYLHFARLPAPALDIARRALDEDTDFRERVAGSLSQSDVGEAGWLWLRRPDGWEARLDAITRAEQERERADREERGERDAQRKLVHAEDRARRAEALAAAHARELVELRAGLAEERGTRQAVERDADEIVVQARELNEQRQAAIRRLKEVEAELARRNGEVKALRVELRARDTELDALRSAPPPTVAPAPPPPPAPQASTTRDAALAAAVGGAARAADALSAALAQASALLEPAATPQLPSPPPPVDAPGRHVSRRKSAALPPGVLDDTPEAAEHLLRVPKGVLVVDGYNVSMTAWGSHPIAVQRARLVDALAALHARTGTDVEVVFDGAEPVGPVVPAAARAGVRVRFSPPDVEADDVVLERLDTLPSERCVVVASSDARVREGARRRGANVLSAPQLIAALRR